MLYIKFSRYLAIDHSDGETQCSCYGFGLFLSLNADGAVAHLSGHVRGIDYHRHSWTLLGPTRLGSWKGLSAKPERLEIGLTLLPWCKIQRLVLSVPMETTNDFF